jgi:probable FeS assembly SUF system protein SufT
MANQERILSRDVVAVQIPSGDKITLNSGAKVYITQTLGGSFTVMTDTGLARIDGRNGDALGEQAADHGAASATAHIGAPDPEAIWDQLKRVYDPEIPVNIVDLGLVYSMEVVETEAGGAYKVNVAMTLTAPGCGMGPAIAEDARGKVMLVPGVAEADVRITWEPAWNQQMISEEGKMKLGLI